MVIPLFLLGITTLALWQENWFYKWATIGQLGLHGAAFLGFLFHGTRLGRLRILSLPFFFDMVYVAAAVALVNLFSGARHDIWTTQPQSLTAGNLIINRGK
ncbi:MAG: hypothetical protein HYR94_15200 [Chloroflexi bacterium]|nr:hypothetical protein [Chloroflexota bacterium]